MFASQAAKHLVSVTLKLGGKSPTLVDATLLRAGEVPPWLSKVLRAGFKWV